MLDHLGIQSRDPSRAASFYDAVLAPLGGARIMEPAPGVVGYGGADGKPDFWVGPLAEGSDNRPIHVAFVAADRASVEAFVAAAQAFGTEVLHEARLWPEYHPSYYGGFVRDPDGNNVEAVCHTH
jgi:catechol 2,3-dioxygenase-like lactoylglutathione lyase family enzyme